MDTIGAAHDKILNSTITPVSAYWHNYSLTIMGPKHIASKKVSKIFQKLQLKYGTSKASTGSLIT